MKVIPSTQQRQTEELTFRANLVALAAALDRERPPADEQLLDMEWFAAVVRNHRSKVGDE
jgi:hypothetical protein